MEHTPHQEDQMLDLPYYCSVALPASTAGLTRAAALNAARWEVTRLNVHFLDGTPKLHQRVMDVARTWTGPGMARLTFTNDEGTAPDVRVSFTPGRGSWSYLGTQAQNVNAAEPTMNFGWIDEDSDEVKLRAVVLHEFGHAIGLIHEHQNPKQPIKWNVEAVVKDQSGPPNNWSRAQIESNIFSRYKLEDLTATNVDGTSIMMYPVPARWTLDGFSVGWNTELSDTDRSFIAEAYP